ncbi:hypothetical protein WALSEDRAFT_61384 [Wallemia mellicola CBS 633.66]|uniref:Uncharacterized protein n=1 Tax=Wallemia mellicola (strain ATCC MYA-4683 / CBS 633.66) TaxID=671144 RepID=I4Y6F6_WALMC|nr:hypothetical protein WALSEDRAFT_61384 [Wallemia mellicola CBS 633.66]EIM19548.1 hypothetical protein WALSEDRAFT_61384 [Wallemia mellicola CBS 633.66]|eukprot:XP_006960346.1 hypothetical protein WALSEDRAFT_61384 [Wallemia mellicola CBS 633.66]
MTVYPGELLALFNGSATVSLVSHKPSIRDVEEYEDWVYVGHSVAMLLIAPKYKDGLFRKLRSLNYAIELAPYRCAFIKGNQITLMSILVHCLEAIRCNAVRIQAYGLKAPINLSEELITFRSPHPHRHTNSFDIGVTERPDITGLALLKGVRPLVVTFPICAPAGKGYGTVRLETKVSQKFIDPFALKDQMIETKMYSKVAHVIKSFGCKYPLFKAKTINVLKRDIIRLSKPLKKSATNLMKTFKVTVPI